jgi:isoleucyl-tRNA synthetase
LPASVTDDAGTGFVHIAPGHGADDYNLWVNNKAAFAAAGTPDVPQTVGPDGAYYPHVPLFAGARVLDDKGREGDANERVIKALVEAGKLAARGRLKHQYPHSWRSKAPLIFRNTPQWFIAMDKPLGGPGDTLRSRALKAIAATQWVPPAGENRINGMIENRPDWVISRQRAWGVPITVFVREDEKGNVVELAPGPDFAANEELSARIAAAFEAEGADAWFSADPRRFLEGLVPDPSAFTPVMDILDVWFDSGSTHAFTLEVREDLKTRRRVDGGPDRVMYLEGSDQHRGWFHSSLLESCGTRGRAPYDIVVTHGFTLDEQGRKMSKSLGNTVAPQDVIKQYGADILRLWTASVDYWDDQRIGPEILKSVVDQYRKLRNTIRWMLGTLHHFDPSDLVPTNRMPELERLMLHRLCELDGEVRKAYATYDYKRVVSLLASFMTSDLSAFYFDVRKDALYCDPASSVTRRSALTVIDQLFRCVVTWLAPVLVFTAEEAWLARFGEESGSVHLQQFPIIPPEWRNDELAARWTRIRRVRRVVTGALEIERAQKRIGSSLEAAPVVYVADAELRGLRHHRHRRRGPGRSVPARRRAGCRCGAGEGRGAQVRPLVEDLARCRQGCRLPGRDPARCGGAARVGCPPQGCLTHDARPARFPRRGSHPRARPSDEALALLRRRDHDLDRAGRAHALHVPDACLEPGHFLRPLPAIERDRTLGADRPVLRGGGWPVGLARAQRAPGGGRGARPPHRRGRRQCHRQAPLRRGARLRAPARRLLQLVRLQCR